MDAIHSAAAAGPLSAWLRSRAKPVMAALIVLPALGYIIAQCYPFFFHSMDHNAREVFTYGLDQYIILGLVERAIHDPLFRVQFFDYPHLYFNLNVLTAFVYSKVLPLDERTLYFILRFMSLLGGCLTVVLTFLFAERFLGILAAAFAAATLAVTPAMLEWCVEPHPDTWQMFLLTLSLYFCTRAVPGVAGTHRAERPDALRLAPLWAAAAAAGAAFSTKYLGTMLLPLLVIAVVAVPAPALAPSAFERLARRLALLAGIVAVLFAVAGAFATPANVLSLFPNWNGVPQPSLTTIIATLRWLLCAAAVLCLVTALFYLRVAPLAPFRPWAVRLALLFGVLAIFVAAFALTSPWAVWRLQFFPGLYVMTVFVNLGQGSKADWFGPQWLSLISSVDLFGPFVALLACLGSVGVLAAWLKGGFRIWRTPLVFVLGWVLLFVTFLVTRVNIVKTSYVLPVAPAIALLAAAGVIGLRMLLAPLVGMRTANAAAATVAVAAMAVHLAQSADAFAAYREKYLPRTLAPEKVMMGDWMLRCVPHAARVMAAAYSYVPPEFGTAVLFTDHGYYSSFKAFAPDLVILDTRTIALYSGKVENATTDWVGTTGDIKRYYDVVVHSGEWRKGPEFGQFQIFLTPGLAEHATGQPGCS